MWQTDCEAPTANVKKRGDSLMKCEYKVERISDDLEKYLNEKGSQGWRCASVTTATGLGWTYVVILERAAKDQPVDTEIKIMESKAEADDEKLNEKKAAHDSNLEEHITEQKEKSTLEKEADDEKLNEKKAAHDSNLEEHITEQKEKSTLEKIAEFYVAFEFAWFFLNIAIPSIRSLLIPDYSSMDTQINPIKWIILFIMIIVDLILLFILNKQDRKGGMKNDEI